MSAHDGGPAFGQVVEMQCVRVDPFGSEEWEPALVKSGMSLRDYFAAKAMECNNWPTPEEGASRCYAMADAMLRAREAK